jgi:hypothetical protein
MTSELSSCTSVSDHIIDECYDYLSLYASFMHLNIQSLVPKLDLLNVESRHDVLH